MLLDGLPDLENFGAYRKGRALFDFVVEDVRAIE